MYKVIESQLRTISKTLIYRVLCTIGIGLLALAVGATGAQAGTLALLAFFVGMIMYYVHDRVWNQFNWRRDDQGRESVLRSVVKTIIYRIIVMIVVVFLVKVIMAEDTQTAVAFAIGQFIINLVLYYIVERVANRVQKGRITVDNTLPV
jgi:uncharacterized membrane protein